MSDTSLIYKRRLSILLKDELRHSHLKASTPTSNRQLRSGNKSSIWNMPPICENDSQNVFFDADSSSKKNEKRELLIKLTKIDLDITLKNSTSKLANATRTLDILNKENEPENAKDKESSHVESQLSKLSDVERNVQKPELSIKLIDICKSGGNKKTIANSSNESKSENTHSLVVKIIEETFSRKLNSSALQKDNEKKQSSLVENDGSSSLQQPVDQSQKVANSENGELGTGSNKNLNEIDEQPHINIIGTSKTTEATSPAEGESVNSSFVPAIAKVDKSSLLLSASVEGDEYEIEPLSGQDEITKDDQFLNGEIESLFELDESMDSDASSTSMANTRMDKSLVKPNVTGTSSSLFYLPDFLKVLRKSSKTKRRSLSDIVEMLRDTAEKKINKETGSHEPSNEDKLKKTSVAGHNQTIVEASCSAANTTLKDSSMEQNTSGSTKREKRKFDNETEVAEKNLDKENVAYNWPEGCQKVKKLKNAKEIAKQKKNFSREYLKLIELGKNTAVPGMKREHLCNILNHSLPEFSDTINLFNADIGDFVNFEYHLKLDKSKFQPADDNKLVLVSSVNTFRGVRMHQMQILPKGETPFLLLDKYDRTLLVLQGTGIVQVHQSTQKIEKYDCILIPRGVVHSIDNTSDNEDLVIECMDTN